MIIQSKSAGAEIKSGLVARQYPDEVATGEKQSALGKIVTRLMENPTISVLPSDVKGLPASDANFIERFVNNPKIGILVARYPWAPIALYNKQLLKQATKEHAMNSSLIAGYADTVYRGLGGAKDAFVYADGTIDYRALREVFKTIRRHIVSCAVRQDVYDAVKALSTLVLKGDELPNETVFTAKRVTFDQGSSETSKQEIAMVAAALHGGNLYSFDFTQTIQGETSTKRVYVALGVGNQLKTVVASPKVAGRSQFYSETTPPGYSSKNDRKPAGEIAGATKPEPASEKIQNAKYSGSPGILKARTPGRGHTPVYQHFDDAPVFQDEFIDDGRPRKRHGKKPNKENGKHRKMERFQ